MVNAQIAGVAGQNAVENNELVQRTPESVMQNIEKRKEKIKSEVCTGSMSQAACNKAIAAEFDRNNAEFGKMLIDLATLVPGISEADALSILLNEKTLSGDETSRIWGAIGIITAGYGQKLRLAGKELLALNPAEELVTSTGHVIKNVEANAIKSESRGVGKEAGKDAAKAGKDAGANKHLDKAALEAQHGKGNVQQGGGHYKETKDKIHANQVANQKGNESSNFREHVAKEQEVNANLDKRPEDKIWTETHRKAPVSNAYGHWDKHKNEFPEFQNSKQYVDATHNFVRNPPEGTLTKIRNNGDTLYYNPSTNIFAIKNADGTPRTMFKPNPANHGYKTNLEYFNAQK
ncbi:hypothetical protein [Snodgrassella communis]|uniref:hypothetical protein n=1 Tax=Snodgrassella communis TaxID=2946699 RepID=UPI001EF4DF18|nr:hypothetical protein [Snodgrassella communis]